MPAAASQESGFGNPSPSAGSVIRTATAVRSSWAKLCAGIAGDCTLQLALQNNGCAAFHKKKSGQPMKAFLPNVRHDFTLYSRRLFAHHVFLSPRTFSLAVLA